MASRDVPAVQQPLPGPECQLQTPRQLSATLILWPPCQEPNIPRERATSPGLYQGQGPREPVLSTLPGFLAQVVCEWQRQESEGELLWVGRWHRSSEQVNSRTDTRDSRVLSRAQTP